MSERDVAIVLSGGGMNGVLLELGFLQRLRVSSLWPRVGRIYGTSAGALTGTMAALDLLDELEEFVLGLQPGDIFRPQSLWRLPLNGLHEYALPATVGERLLDPLELGERLCEAPIEVVIFATDVSDENHSERTSSYELVYSSHETPPEILAQAVLASAAISALVLPMRVGGRIATDGSWVRNFPLAHAYARPGVRTIVAFRYIPRYPRMGVEMVVRLRRRFERFRRVLPVRAFVQELKEAEERDRRGEPAHLPETILRLARASIVRNTVLEERLAAETDESIRELARLRADVRELVAGAVRDRRARARLLAELDDRFGAARFPFRHERSIPRITVRGSAEGVSLETGFGGEPWTAEAKRMLIARGHELTDAELREAGVDATAEAAEESAG
jgi:predicted acylesterase/phospholipase RssA